MWALLLLWSGALGTPQTWVGNEADVGVSVAPGVFYSMFNWIGSEAIVGIGADNPEWLGDLYWIGSPATIGLAIESGFWDGTGMPFGRTGISVISGGDTDGRVGGGRTAMMVGAGRTKGATR